MINVLITDDEPHILAGLRMSADWAGMGFDIAAEASDGAAALDKIKLIRPALVVIDLAMPGIKGIDVIKQARGGGFSGHFIILSGGRDFAAAQAAINHGVIQYLSKPIDPEELTAALLLAKQKIQADGLMEENAIHQAHDPFDEIFRYIEKNYHKNLTLGGIAALFGYNSAYLGRLFHKKSGLKFNHYIDKLRMAKAEALLQSSSMKVYEVAARVGYIDVDYFNRKFKKYRGATPSSVRNKKPTT